MPFLPLFHSCPGKLVIGVFCAFGPRIQDNRGPKELLHRNLIDGGLLRRKMYRRIQMRPVMLQHPEAPRKIPILLDRSVDFRLKNFFVARPTRQFVVDRIAQIKNTRFAAGDFIKHGIPPPHLGKPAHLAPMLREPPIR